MRPRLQLQFSPFKGTGQNTGMSTQPDGTFRAMLPEGDYRVSWASLPAGYEIKSITSGSVDLLSNSLKVAADTPAVTHQSPVVCRWETLGEGFRARDKPRFLSDAHVEWPKRGPDSIDGES